MRDRLMDLRSGLVDEGLEKAAKYMDDRADELEAANGGGPIQNMMGRIFRDESKNIRKLKKVKAF